MPKKAIFLLLGAWFLAAVPPAMADDAIPPTAAPAQHIEVRVDPRVELAATMARLAGYEEYQGHGIPAYDRAVDAHFAAYRGHPAIAVMRGLRTERHIAYNAVVEAGLMADADWTAVVPLSPRPSSLDTRWDAASLHSFLDAAREFEHDSGARAFFTDQQAIQGQAEASVRANLEGRLDVDWYRTQMPPQDIARFVVVPGLLDGANSYAVRVGNTIYGVLATPAFRDGEPIAYPADEQLALLVHEFHHTYLNPWMDANFTALSGPATRLYAVVEPRMTELAYGDPRIMLYETMVRANTLSYLRAHGEAAVLRSAIAEDRDKGFAWTPALADLLDKDVAAGKPRFDDGTAARVAAFLDDWARDNGARIDAEQQRLAAEREQALQRGPQIQSLSPTDGSVVAPGKAVLEIHFDRAMDGRIAIFGDVPEVNGAPEWDATKRVLRVPVVLQAGAHHSLGLNQDDSDGFSDSAGEKLVPRTWAFDVQAH